MIPASTSAHVVPVACTVFLVAGAAAAQSPSDVLQASKLSDLQIGALDDVDAFGKSVVDLGDLDGDGVSDLAIGANGDDDGFPEAGAVWILFMNSDATIRSTQKISSLSGGFTGILGRRDHFGNSLACPGDLDGDGVQDLAVGARYDDDGGFNRGAVWILFLNSNGTVRRHQKISQISGGFFAILRDNGRFSSGLAAMGDLDGDGVGDLAVGASEAGYPALGSGSVWILRLHPDGTVKKQVQIATGLNGFGGTFDVQDHFSTAIAPLPDLDLDGVDDLAVGALWDDDGGLDRGAVWILFLNADGTVKGYQKISSSAGGFSGELDDEDLFGHSLACAGDLNLDGIPDLAVGAQGDDDGGANRGAIWLLFLERDGTVQDFDKITGANLPLSNYDRFGRSCTPVADYDGNGFPDLLVGSPGDDDGGTDRGAGYILSFHGAAVTGPLSADRTSISLAGGGGQNMRLDAGPRFAGRAYLLLGSEHGTNGFSLGGAFVPLTPDSYLRSTFLKPGESPLLRGWGLLDAEGRAYAKYQPAAGAQPTARPLHHAFVVLWQGSARESGISPAHVAFASNAVPLDILP